MGQAVLFAEPDHQARQTRSEHAGEFEERIAPAHAAGDEVAREDLRDQRLPGGREETTGEAAEDDDAVDDRQLGPPGGQEFGDEKEQTETEHRGQRADGDPAAVVRIGHMAGEEDRADERDDFGQADRAERQGRVVAIVLGQPEHLPGDGDVLDLDGQRAEDDRREIQPEGPGGDGGSGSRRGGGHPDTCEVAGTVRQSRL